MPKCGTKESCPGCELSQDHDLDAYYGDDTSQRLGIVAEEIRYYPNVDSAISIAARIGINTITISDAQLLNTVAAATRKGHGQCRGSY
jgi:hypothetical protein